MNTVIECKALVSNLKTGERPVYRLIPVGITTMKKDEFVQSFALDMGKSKADTQYFLDKLGQKLVECALSRKSVDLDWMGVRITIEGSIAAMNDQPTKADNPVRLKITLKGDVNTALAGVTLKNVTRMVEAALHEIMQVGASALSRIENDNLVVINGKGLTLTPDAEDEGVFLEKAGVVKAKAVIVYSDDSTIKADFSGASVENGVYDLVVYTRDGASAADGISARRLTRKITVAK